MTDREQLSTKDIAASTAERAQQKREEREKPVSAAPPSSTPSALPPEAQPAIFPEGEIDALRARWEAIQTGFVDEPKAAVTEADALVAQVITTLAEVFSRERTQLEQQWDRGDEVSTEDLRIALQRYRSFFTRLLSV
jgi:hypothetical protein